MFALPPAQSEGVHRGGSHQHGSISSGQRPEHWHQDHQVNENVNEGPQPNERAVARLGSTD